MNVTYLHPHTRIGKAQQKIYDRRARRTGPKPDDEPDTYLEASIEMTEDIRYIRAKNTGQLYKMDKEDWMLVKDIPWYETGIGNLHTFQGQTFESYVGIVGARHHPFGPRDKRRLNYQGA